MSLTLGASALCGALVLGNALGVALASRRLRPAASPVPRPDPAWRREAVSIVRPVCGLEPHAEETLGSGFRLDHPDFELIFCVARADDPVVPLVRRLIAAHPAVPARLLVGDLRVSDNPKLNNCARGWAAARHGWVVLADSNVLMPPDYLDRLRAAWREGETGLVCSAPAGSRPDGFWAEVECAWLNGYQARWQYAGAALGQGFAQGKSMLWRRGLLEAWGGIGALGAEAAEDAAATKLVRAAGLQVHLADAPFEQPLGRRGLRAVWSRQARWARLRRATFPLFFAPELLSSALPALLAGGVAAAADGRGIAAAIGLVLALWYAPELWLLRRQGWFRNARTPLALLLRDALIPAVWVHAWMGNDFVWRGNAMEALPRGTG